MHSLSALKLPSTNASLVTKKIIIIKMTRHITNEGASTTSAGVIFFDEETLPATGISLSFFLSLLKCDRGYEGLQV